MFSSIAKFINCKEVNSKGKVFYFVSVLDEANQITTYFSNNPYDFSFGQEVELVIQITNYGGNMSARLIDLRVI